MLEDTQFDFDDFVEDVVHRSGGQTATADDILKIRRSLRIILERWAALRYNTWRVKTTSVAAGGVQSFNLPSDVDDVFQINVRNSPLIGGTDGSESTLRRIGPEEYAQLTNKLTKGQPSQYFLNRTMGRPQLYIYPVGRSGQVETLDIWYVSRPAEFDTYGNEVDAPGRWLEALVTGTALELARKRPREDGTYDEGLISRLKMEADEANLIAQNADRQRVRYRFRMRR